MRTNFGRKHEGKRPHGRPIRGLEGTIKMNLTELVCEDVNWIHLDQNKEKKDKHTNWHCKKLVLQMSLSAN